MAACTCCYVNRLLWTASGDAKPAITSAVAQVWCLHDGSLQAVRTAYEPLATKGRKAHATARTVETLSDPEALHAAIRECAVSRL